jgi:hypothetical protein
MGRVGSGRCEHQVLDGCDERNRKEIPDAHVLAGAKRFEHRWQVLSKAVAFTGHSVCGAICGLGLDGDIGLSVGADDGSRTVFYRSFHYQEAAAGRACTSCHLG